MVDVVQVLLWSAIAVTVAAGAVYIIGFLVSMFVTMFTAPADALTHHHHHPVTG